MHTKQIRPKQASPRPQSASKLKKSTTKHKSRNITTKTTPKPINDTVSNININTVSTPQFAPTSSLTPLAPQSFSATQHRSFTTKKNPITSSSRRKATIIKEMPYKPVEKVRYNILPTTPVQSQSPLKNIPVLTRTRANNNDDYDDDDEDVNDGSINPAPFTRPSDNNKSQNTQTHTNTQTPPSFGRQPAQSYINKDGFQEIDFGDDYQADQSPPSPFNTGLSRSSNRKRRLDQFNMDRNKDAHPERNGEDALLADLYMESQHHLEQYEQNGGKELFEPKFGQQDDHADPNTALTTSKPTRRARQRDSKKRSPQFAYEHENDPKLTTPDDEILSRSTIDSIYPNYFISSRPNLVPTIPYVIDPVIQELLGDTLPHTLPRVGSFPEMYDDIQIFEKMTNWLRTREVQISSKITVSEFDLASGSHSPKYREPHEVISDELEKRQQNWGIIATGKIIDKEQIMKIPTTTLIVGSTGLADNPDLRLLQNEGYIEEHINVEHIHNVDWMVNAMRLVIGTSPQGRSRSHPFLSSTSFALGLLANRLAGTTSTFHPVILGLPKEYPATHVMNHPDGLYSAAIAPRTTGLSEAIKFVWTLLNETTGAQFLSTYAKYIKSTPNLLPTNPNMVLKVREMANLSMVEIFSKIALPFDREFSRDTFLDLFEWGVLTTVTRSISGEFGQPDDPDDAINDLLMIDPRLAITPPADYLNQSPDPNCSIELPTRLQHEKFQSKLLYILELNNGDLPMEQVEAIRSESPAIVVRANRRIDPGEQLTISYNPLKPLKLEQITPLTEDKVESILTSSYDLKELFTQSLARVPHALDYLDGGQYQEDPTHNSPAIYGFYPSFHINDDIVLYRHAVYTQGRKVLPSFDYLAKDFKTALPEHTIIDPKISQDYYNLSRPDTVFTNDGYYASLAWKDAPIKYILPTLHDNFDPNLRSHQKYTDIMNQLASAVSVDKHGREVPLMTKFKTGWLGPSPELEAMMRFLACSGFYAPEPEKFHHERLQRRGNKNNGQNNDKNDRYSPTDLDTKLEFTPADSHRYIVNRMHQRIDTVLDKVEQKIRKKYSKNNPTIGLSAGEWLEGFSEPIDEENEYGKLIQYMFTLMQYQDYVTSPIVVPEDDDGDDGDIPQSPENDQSLESSDITTSEDEFDEQIRVVGERKKKDREGKKQPKITGQDTDNNTPEFSWQLQPQTNPTGDKTIKSTIISASDSNIKLPPSTIPGLQLLQQTQKGLNNGDDSAPLFNIDTIRSVAPDLVNHHPLMAQSRQKIDRALEQVEQQDKLNKGKKDNNAVASSITAPTPNELSDQDDDDKLTPGELLPPRSIKNAVADYYHSILSGNFDYAMTSIHQYHSLSLVSHSNKVMATRLGLVDWHTNQTEIGNGTNAVGSGQSEPGDDGSQDFQNSTSQHKQNHNNPVLVPFWHSCDGIVPVEFLSATTKFKSLPDTRRVNGKVEL